MPPNFVTRAIVYIAELPSLVRHVSGRDELQSTIHGSLSALSRNERASHDVVVGEAVEDTFYLALFGHICVSLQRRLPVRTEVLLTRSLNVGEADSLARFFNARLVVGFLSNFKWRRLYASFAETVAYASASWQPWHDLVDLWKAREQWRGLQSSEQVLAMQVDGVPVGDLVNDSYLRFKPAKTLALRDRYLLIVMWQALRDVRRARRYFFRRRPKLYLTSYSTYIQHGIAVRTALLAGTRVLSFGNYQEFCKTLSLSDWFHTRNPENYASGFELLEDREGKLASADAALSARVAGEVDGATAYMRASAYVGSDHPGPDVAGAAVVFLHDFFDSPHVYADLVFHDFWEWICCTIDTLTEAGIPYFIKPHPNQIFLSDGVLGELTEKYPGTRVLPASVSNRQLALGGMRCAITAHGTVAHEMAFLGVPSIGCARHPHVSFGFCRTARSRAEYVEALRSVPIAEFDAARGRVESLSFFHMHNRDLGAAELELRDRVLQLRLDSNAGTLDSAAIAEGFSSLDSLPAYESFVNRCERLLLETSPLHDPRVATPGLEFGADK